MATDACPVCGWTIERNESCHYNSDMRLCCATTDGGIWFVGSQLMITERIGTPLSFDAQNPHILKKCMAAPGSSIIAEWTEDNGAHFRVMKRINGATPEKAWPDLLDADRDLITKQTAKALGQQMTTDVSCTACGWKGNGPYHCKPHVRVFYAVSDRAAWSVGSQLVIKNRNNTPPNFDARNIRFLQEFTTIPVPSIKMDWTEDNGKYIEVMGRIDGVSLKEAWTGLLEVDRDHIAKQTAEALAQLRLLRDDQMQSLDGKPLYSAFLFRNGFGRPHGPCKSDEELWGQMAQALEGLPDSVVRQMQQRMPPAAPYTFTHGDLTIENIIVKDGKLAGIIDWEASGYFPVWWEFTAAGISDGGDDQDWKTLLQKYMDKHQGALNFWRDYYALTKYPKLDELGKTLLEKLESKDNLGCSDL